MLPGKAPAPSSTRQALRKRKPAQLADDALGACLHRPSPGKLMPPGAISLLPGAARDNAECKSQPETKTACTYGCSSHSASFCTRSRCGAPHPRARVRMPRSEAAEQIDTPPTAFCECEGFPRAGYRQPHALTRCFISSPEARRGRFRVLGRGYHNIKPTP